jgi:hypothetical protein
MWHQDFPLKDNLSPATTDFEHYLCCVITVGGAGGQKGWMQLPFQQTNLAPSRHHHHQQQPVSPSSLTRATRTRSWPPSAPPTFRRRAATWWPARRGTTCTAARVGGVGDGGASGFSLLQSDNPTVTPSPRPATNTPLQPPTPLPTNPFAASPPPWGLQRVRQLLSRLPLTPNGPTTEQPVYASLSSVGGLAMGGMDEIRAAFSVGGGAGTARPPPPPAAAAAAARPAESASAARGLPPPDSFFLLWPSNRDIVHRKGGSGVMLSGAKPGEAVLKHHRRGLLARQECVLGWAGTVPHAKVYWRCDAATQEVLWVMVGSHNLSHPAW